MVAAPVPIPSYPDTRSVLRGRDMLCFGHDWSGDPLSKTHLMRLLARDNRILWINSIGYRAPTASSRDLSRIVNKLRAAMEPVREVERNIFVLNPLAIPAFGISWMPKVNRQLLKYQVWRAMDALDFRKVVNWTFNPSAAVVAGALGEDLLVYYCVDEFTAFAGIPPQLVELERSLLRKADLVVVSSEKLLKRKSVENPRTTLVRHGVAYDHFRKALSAETRIPDDVAELPKPVIGYFGLMAEDWIDIDLMVHVAKHFSGGSMVLLGKVTTDLSRLTALSNVHLLGRKPFETLPAYCKAFDVAMNPFPINEVTLNSNPLKVREYLAAGLPVVSTRIPEVEVIADRLRLAPIKQARIADDKEGFVRAIEEALADPGPSASRSESMRDESWEAKLEEVRRAVAALGRG
jgi:glycosyltransferase involved in cell wall biosynthesis